jgi:Tfp pilus assembly protein PilX
MRPTAGHKHSGKTAATSASCHFPTRHQSERGAALLAALCFAMVLAIALASYLRLTYTTLDMSSRGLQNTRAAELAETGMEEAVWAQNNSSWSDWSISGSTATKTLPDFSLDGGVIGRVTLTVTNYNSTTATRTVTAVGTVGTAAQLTNGTAQHRTLTSTSSRAPLFANAVTATTGLVKFTAAGTSSLIDSYDSSVGGYAASVGSPSSPNVGFAAVIASGNTSTSSATVQLTNAQVKGYVATLATGPSYSTSALLVGPSTAPTTKIDTSRISTDPYQPIPDVVKPSVTGALALPTGTATIGTAGATTPTVYTTPGVDMTSGKLTVNGPVQIVVTGTGAYYIGLHGGTPSVEVTANGTLEVYSAGDIAIYGNGINNLTQDPKRAVVYSTNALTVPDMNTSTDFYGAIYTPTGDFKVWSNNAIYGAIVARNVTFSGSAPVVHYDVNLRRTAFSGVTSTYVVNNLRDSTNGG